MKEFLLGIDVGTSACKAAVFDRVGTALAQASRPCAVHHPRPGWAEQNPEDWWEAVVLALNDIWAAGIVSPKDIAGVGIAGQSWSAVAVDGRGRALCNTPIWYDTRAQLECEELKARIGEERIFRLCGNPVQPSYTLPKILWYQKHLPEIYGKTDKILQSNSFIGGRLTGRIAHDLSQGYGMFCFDMAHGAWDRDMAREMGIDPAMLCELVRSSDIIGAITAEAAAATGLLAGTPVAGGGLDAACGTLGAGVVAPGQTQEQGGQAGGMSICVSRCLADPALILSMHVTGDTWLLQGGTVGGGGVLKWMEREFCASERAEAATGGANSFEIISEECGAVPAGCEGLVFLPYMAGERSPIWDPQAKGVFFGLDYTKTRAHMLRAGMEGAAYALRHNLEVAEACGAGVTELRAMGGAANSFVWTQIKADVTGKPIAVPSSDTATTLGAALLAGVGVGYYAGFKEAVGSTVSVSRVHEPNKSLVGVYARGYDKYRKLYENLKSLMREE